MDASSCLKEAPVWIGEADHPSKPLGHPPGPSRSRRDISPDPHIVRGHDGAGLPIQCLQFKAALGVRLGIRPRPGVGAFALAARFKADSGIGERLAVERYRSRNRRDRIMLSAASGEGEGREQKGEER